MAVSPAFATDYPPNATVQSKVLGESVTRPPVHTPVSTTVKVSPLRAATPTRVSVPTTQGLAFTGSDAIVGGLVLGSVLVALGSGVLVAGRRRGSASA